MSVCSVTHSLDAQVLEELLRDGDEHAEVPRQVDEGPQLGDGGLDEAAVHDAEEATHVAGRDVGQADALVGVARVAVVLQQL